MADLPDRVGALEVGLAAKAGAGATNIIQMRALSAHFRANFRLSKLRAGRGPSPQSTSYRESSASPKASANRRAFGAPRPGFCPSFRRRFWHRGRALCGFCRCGPRCLKEDGELLVVVMRRPASLAVVVRGSPQSIRWLCVQDGGYPVAVILARFGAQTRCGSNAECVLAQHVSFRIFVFDPRNCKPRRRNSGAEQARKWSSARCWRRFSSKRSASVWGQHGSTPFWGMARTQRRSADHCQRSAIVSRKSAGACAWRPTARLVAACQRDPCSYKQKA